MSRKRRNFTAKFKSDLVLELLKGEIDLNTLALGPDYESKFSPKPFDD